MKHSFCISCLLFLMFAAAPALSANAEDSVQEPQPQIGWQKTEDGRRCYVQEDDSLVCGEAEIEGIPYLFSQSGLQRLGWQTVNGKRYFYDSDGNAVFGWLHWRDEDYYISQENGKQTGTAEMEDGTRIFDSYGVVQKGLITDGTEWFYADETGLLKGGEQTIDGKPYLFGEDGRFLKGWQTASDGVTRYYGDEYGTIVTGWIHLGEDEYYADPERGMLTGMQVLNNKKYCFGDTGILCHGVCYGDGAWWYADSFGVIGTVSGEADMDGIPVLVDENSGIVPEWQIASDGSVRYFDTETGSFLTGWQTVEDIERYFLSDGVLATGSVAVEGETVIFTADGSRAVGWCITAEGYGFYCETAGVPITGVQTVGETEYTFAEDGSLRSTFLYLDDKTMIFPDDGIYVKGWYTDENGNTYCCSEEGALYTGWATVGMSMYYFSEDGILTVSDTVDGFTIDEKGVARNANAIAADAQIAAAGTTAAAVYKAFVSRYRYSKIEDTRTYAQIKAAGWESLITYLLANKRGVCYYLAAGLDYFYQRMGFTTRMVHATHNTGDHYWVQVLTSSGWLNFDPTYNNRSALTWSDIIARGNGGYRVNGFIDVTYDRRGAYVDETYTEYTAS